MALSLFAKLGLDKTGFDAGMSAASKTGAKFGSDLKASIAGAFTLAAAGLFLKRVTETVNRIKDLSEQFAITTDEVQNLDFALKQSGMSFEDLSPAMSKLVTARREAVEQDGKMRESFKQMGITVEQLADPTTRWIDLLMRMSKALADGTAKGDAQSMAMEILGSKAGRLANVLKDLSTIKAPTLFEQREIEKIDEASKAMERFGLATQTALGSAMSNWLDYWDIVTGKHAMREIEAARAPTKRQIEDANRAKHERIAAEDAARNAGLARIGIGDEDQTKKRAISEVADLLRLLGGIGAPNSVAEKGLSGLAVDSDQFQRIGAFTGGAADPSLDQLRKQTHSIEELRRDLTARGVVVKGTD